MPRKRNFLSVSCFLLITGFVYSMNIKVLRVIDGDTFEAENGEKVRLVGINAPEISDVFGIESKEYLKKLIDGKYVSLQSDEINQDRDRYGRLLRYVKVANVDINKKMIQDGFAFAFLKYRFTHSTEYRDAQLDARNNNIGIWGDNLDETSENKKNIQIKRIEENQMQISKWHILGALISIILFVGIYSMVKK